MTKFPDVSITEPEEPDPDLLPVYDDDPFNGRQQVSLGLHTGRVLREPPSLPIREGNLYRPCLFQKKKGPRIPSRLASHQAAPTS